MAFSGWCSWLGWRQSGLFLFFFSPTRKQWRQQTRRRGPVGENKMLSTSFGANGRIDPVGNRVLKDFRCNFKRPQTRRRLLVLSLPSIASCCRCSPCALWPPSSEIRCNPCPFDPFSDRMRIFIHWLTSPDWQRGNYTCQKIFSGFWFFIFRVSVPRRNPLQKENEKKKKLYCQGNWKQ